MPSDGDIDTPPLAYISSFSPSTAVSTFGLTDAGGPYRESALSSRVQTEGAGRGIQPRRSFHPVRGCGWPRRDRAEPHVLRVGGGESAGSSPRLRLKCTKNIGTLENITEEAHWPEHFLLLQVVGRHS